ncbi:MAG: imidazole glycerol phosphate synthase subunit HisH [Bacteroidetes bacterium SW_8_64_56]|nr:MAG: imidazole glycerol phosphate synthase subunit HisH [Bacteroidetes bacterium SW_8_64_56]
MITIIDYGIGNLRSIEKAFQNVGATVHRTDDVEDVASAERLVLPGVGAFRACIDEIRRRDLEGPIQEAIHRGVPFLGVCVGMQLLFETGYEKGEHEGLGVLPGYVAHFREVADGALDDLPVPHMGWNTIEPTRANPLLRGLGDTPHVYFVHRENVFGVQFHPEKSQAAGLGLLENFSTLKRTAQADDAVA